MEVQRDSSRACSSGPKSESVAPRRGHREPRGSLRIAEEGAGHHSATEAERNARAGRRAFQLALTPAGGLTKSCPQHGTALNGTVTTQHGTTAKGRLRRPLPATAWPPGRRAFATRGPRRANLREHGHLSCRVCAMNVLHKWTLRLYTTSATQRGSRLAAFAQSMFYISGLSHCMQLAPRREAFVFSRSRNEFV